MQEDQRLLISSDEDISYKTIDSSTHSSSSYVRPQFWRRSRTTDVYKKIKFATIPRASISLPTSPVHIEEKKQAKTTWIALLKRIPAVILTVLSSLFLNVSFGIAFFPAIWPGGFPVSRILGVQLCLLSTIISQFVLTFTSNFTVAIALTMVENIPFVHSLASAIIHNLQDQGLIHQALPTIMVAIAGSSIIVGILFYILGYTRMGGIVYFIPRHVIIGCIAGIGVFIFLMGVEVATGEAWRWTLQRISDLFTHEQFPLFITPLCFELLLMFLLSKYKMKLMKIIRCDALIKLCNSPMFPPFYFLFIPIWVYAAIWVSGVPIETAQSAGWFFVVDNKVDFLAIWKAFDFHEVAWSVIAEQYGIIISLTIFSLMHVPINIPSLSLTTGQHCDIDNELRSHGISNMLTGVVGVPQNYLCYSNSVLFYKCGGDETVAQIGVGLLTLVFFFEGPTVIAYIPRAMGGCVLMHIGKELFKEGIYDPFKELDKFEYSSVVIITIVMTFSGMTMGLVAGVILALVTHVLQSSQLKCVRGSMYATTLRSSKWRTIAEQDILDKVAKKNPCVAITGSFVLCKHE